MNAYKRYKNRLERFLQTEKGKRTIHFAYSFGAALVILGAMFKLLHFPYGNEMLFIGMVTEVIVFILSAFDTPVRDYPWEQVFPALGNGKAVEHPTDGSDILTQAMSTPHSTSSSFDGMQQYPVSETPATTTSHAPQGTTEYRSSADNLSLFSTRADTYEKQLESLNRTLSGLNSLYELQLKEVSSQINSIEQINKGLTRLGTMYSDSLPEGNVIKRETEKMAAQLTELNAAYARMLQAMTPNRGNQASADPK
ncbi:MAG: gliding motility protein GldL [Porphyromonadaceae bacterium]|nr:gliding motility protein GldL [Porphyromonadaceae bacterium]